MQSMRAKHGWVVINKANIFKEFHVCRAAETACTWSSSSTSYAKGFNHLSVESTTRGRHLFDVWVRNGTWTPVYSPQYASESQSHQLLNIMAVSTAVRWTTAELVNRDSTPWSNVINVCVMDINSNHISILQSRPGRECRPEAVLVTNALSYDKL